MKTKSIYILSISSFAMVALLILLIRGLAINEVERSIYWNNLGRGLSMSIIEDNGGIINLEKIDDVYKRKSKSLGYTLILRSGYKIDINNHGDVPWGIYIQTKNNIFRSLLYGDVSILAARDDLSVYEMSSDDLYKNLSMWK